jgi:glycosyltransferase involved in cell wall biosynthesis
MIGEGIYQALNKNFNVNFVPPRQNNLSENNKNLITIYADMLWYINQNLYESCPETYIKIAYSMFEGSKLPIQWVGALNNFFDAVIVPDKYLVNIYKNSGVTKPIFVIPMALADLNSIKINNKKNNKFTFGIISGLDKRKCIKESIKAFYINYANNKNFELLIYSYWADPEHLKEIKNMIKKLNCNNIVFNHSQKSRSKIIEKYNEFDCFIACSPGEGFSITPREALKAQIPVICLNYGVQKSICDTNHVYKVTPTKKFDCIIYSYGGYCGQLEYAEAKNIAQAMLEVKKNYNLYKEKAITASKYLKQFSIDTAAEYFKKIISPEFVLIETEDKFINNGIMTSSEEFANKLLYIKNIN